MAVSKFASMDTGDRDDKRSITRWYAVATKVSREDYAVEHLCRQGFDTFLPKTMVTKRIGGRLLDCKAAFFPGYLFVSLDVGRFGWRAVNSTRGVRSLVMAGETPSPLPNEFIEALQATTTGDDIVGARC